DNGKDNDELEDLMVRVIEKIKELHVIYYKPYRWSPAIRIEISSSIANNNDRLYALLQAIKNQCSIPSIMEPYPLYLADRMVKHIAPAIPAYKQVLTRSMTEFEKDDESITNIIFIMHSYRTESGL
ncbi:MAG TPA: DNA double-strand break repair nuclease NurA, partial [Nitrososphaeraceae archaeon]